MEENIGNRNTRFVILIILVAITLTFTIFQFVQVCKIGNRINELQQKQNDLEQGVANLRHLLK